MFKKVATVILIVLSLCSSVSADEYYDLGCYVGSMTREQFYAQKNASYTPSENVVQVKPSAPCRVKVGDKIRQSGDVGWFLKDGDLMTVQKVEAWYDEYSIVCKIDGNGMFHQTYSSRLKFSEAKPDKDKQFVNKPLTASQRERYWIWMAKNYPHLEHLEAPLVWEPAYSVWSGKFRPDLEDKK